MSFLEIRLPEDIRPGMVGGPEFNTEVIEVESGHEKRNDGSGGIPRREYIIEYVSSLAIFKTLHSFFLVVRGRTYGFRMKDWIDFTVEATEGLLDAGVGDGTPTYQLNKRYSYSGNNLDRAITKLVAGTYTVYRDAIAVTVGAGAGEIAINANTGVVTFVADDSEAITSHTPGSSHVFTTAADITGLAIADKVYITGVTGTGATTLNSIAHTISNKSGSGPYTWTLSTNTTGLTTSGGTALAYPQADDVLSWAGEFDVPVRFTSDKFQARVVKLNGAYAVDGLGLKEVRV
jgi:uncharacterized protein (TIGR02217 family)